MFAKVFSQIFDSSIAEDYNCRRMFMDLLVLADSSGVVDMTKEAISRRTNVPIQQVEKYLEELNKPDPSSRSSLEEGRRIVLIDSHRDWGWKIVNYDHYRDVRDEEARRAYFRDKQREHRSKLSKTVKKRQRRSTKITHAEAEEEVEEQIYSAYPKKVGKPFALKAIQRAVEKHGGPLILERTKAFAAARNGDVDFVPHPSTWFNQERYNDDPETWKPRSNGQAPEKPKEKLKWV